MKKRNEEYIGTKPTLAETREKCKNNKKYQGSLRMWKNIDLEAFIEVLRESGEKEEDIQKVAQSIQRIKNDKTIK